MNATRTTQVLSARSTLAPVILNAPTDATDLLRTNVTSVSTTPAVITKRTPIRTASAYVTAVGAAMTAASQALSATQAVPLALAQSSGSAKLAILAQL